jgi:hypothetical protein
MNPHPTWTDARITGLLLLAGALALVLGFATHPEEAADMATQMELTKDAAGAWRMSHYLLAGGILSVAAACLLSIVTVARDCPPSFRAGLLLYALFGIAASPLFLIEAGVVPYLAEAGDLAGFEAWNTAAMAFFLMLVPHTVGYLLLSVPNATSPSPGLPRWLSIAAAVCGAAAVVGVVGAVAGVAALAPLALGVPLFHLYIAWQGVLLLRTRAAVPRAAATPA